MIGISKLYCGQIEPSDALRYRRESAKLPSHLLQFSKDKRPVIVWNVTQQCNLHCTHCYSSSNNSLCTDRLTRQEGLALIDDLADFGVPVLLFSGGEPLMHPDIFTFIDHAKQKSMRTVLSTNGTLITPELAEKLKEAGLSYVGVSLDGMEKTNDQFRGAEGAFTRTIRGIRNCTKAGIKVGLRFTICNHNVTEIDSIFNLLEEETIPRVCFYHLAYSGRGKTLEPDDLTPEQSRAAVDQIIDRTAAIHRSGKNIEALTVGNHCDGPYLYLRMKSENNPSATNVLQLLRMNGGNSSGIGIGCISWDGTVYPDQFQRNHPLGNIREKPFNSIWTETDDSVLQMFRNRKDHLHGRCARCKWLDICNGNLRARAEAATGDLRASDPACYLSDEEIGLT